MTTFSYKRKTANEKGIEKLQEDTRGWEKSFQNYTGEILFLKKLPTSDVFENEIPGMYEKLHEFYEWLEDLKLEKIDLHEELHNHKNDLNGMLECEDINCESFYHSRHQDLADRIALLFKKFNELKLEIFSFCTPLLRHKT